MSPSQNLPKILSPTLHLYHYVLRNGLNDRPETVSDRRNFFTKNLTEITSHLTSKSGKRADEFVRLVPPEQDLSPSGSLLDLTDVPDESLKSNSDRLYLETGIRLSRLAVRRLNDTYLLRFTSYVSSTEGSQSLKFFAILSEHIARLPIELGQTAILAGIIPEIEYNLQDIPLIAAECLTGYFGTPIDPKHLITTTFLGSPFCIYFQPVTVQTFNEFSIESLHLTAVFLYKDSQTEQTADKIYNIFQDMLLSYHKINFFHSQSLALKKILSQQYEKIERLTEDYAQQKWDKESLKKLPQQSLEYYKQLSFLSDQAKTVGINLRNYRECIKQIEQHTQQPMPAFFTEFQQDADYYLEQMKATIGFLSPGLQLYDKLMLSVQTQVSIDDEALQTQQSQRQVKLGQLLTGSCAAIAIGQILTPAITVSVSENYIDKEQPQQTSATSLWIGAILTIVLSLLSGWLVSRWVYQWFTKDKF